MAAEAKKEEINVAALMAEIRERVKADLEANRDKLKPFKNAAADPNAETKAGELVFSEELHFLNSNYAFQRQLDLGAIKSHRRGLTGRLIEGAKRKLAAFIWDFVLRDYFNAERDFSANLVRYLNSVSRYVDARDSAIFWELVKKIDHDTGRGSERADRLAEENRAALYSTEKRLTDRVLNEIQNLKDRQHELESRQNESQALVSSLNAVTQGLESIVSRFGGPSSEALPNQQTTAASWSDVSYFLLENRFRGSNEEIRAHLLPYVEIFKGQTAPVLELGPGRGELQKLFKEAALNSYGVDSNPTMVDECQKAGLNVVLGGALEHLRACQDASLGGVVAIQVIEHLKTSELQELIALCRAKLSSGAKLLFETVNPRSLMALSSNFFRDPTHVFPMHPQTVEFALSLAGFVDVEVVGTSPVPEGAQLQKLPTEDYMTPRWAHSIFLINQNLEQLNRLLYGHQDYYIVARVP